MPIADCEKTTAHFYYRRWLAARRCALFATISAINIIILFVNGSLPPLVIIGLPLVIWVTSLYFRMARDSRPILAFSTTGLAINGHFHHGDFEVLWTEIQKLSLLPSLALSSDMPTIALEVTRENYAALSQSWFNRAAIRWMAKPERENTIRVPCLFLDGKSSDLTAAIKRFAPNPELTRGL
jgi:hypothetical protein